MHRRLRFVALGLGSVASSVCLAAEQNKLLLPAGVEPPPGYSLLADYIHRALYVGSGLQGKLEVGQVLEGPDILYFDRQPFDTQRGSMRAPPGFSLAAPASAALQIVQFVGPIKAEWLQLLRDNGAEPVHYVANHGYLVWADATARGNLQQLVNERRVLQFSAPMPSYFKLNPTLADAFAAGVDRGERFDITVQRYRASNDGRAQIEALGMKRQTEWAPIMAFESARFNATLDEIRVLIEMPDVNWVEQDLPRTLFDEVQAQIVRGHFNPGQTGPAGEGYREWLISKGFPSTAASYPIVDVTDDGIGNRTVNTGDPTLHGGGDISNPSRVIFNQNCTASDPSVGGHGHINANIIGGFDVRTNAQAAGARFPDDYQRGLGINPWTRLGGTRIFAPSFNQSACGGSDAGVILANQVAGAVISNNSWGCSGCAGTYNASSQAYDFGTRDANPGLAGHQPIIYVFAAGNSGPGGGTVGTPGNGKNMITVGASENARPTDENGNWTDGCGIGPTGADNAMDIIGFSSRGPSPGGRVKPEVIAPGTHITGTKANPSTGGSVCDASRPVGNATYASSSGTSHSAPAVAGVASLVYYWIENDMGVLHFPEGDVAPPSPALMKAWLMAHPTYLTGLSANDTLPSNAQGYGMPNLELMFTETPKMLVDQTVLFDDSGQEWTWEGSVADTDEPLRIALAWTDQPGATGTSPQVNNLDLEVTVDGTTYLGNRFSGAFSTTGGTADAANNYEAVFLPAGTSGAIEIRVVATNIAGDGVPGNGDPTDQDFALVCSNCASEPTFTMAIPASAQSICTISDDEVEYLVEVGSALGFADPVTLSLAGEPAGATISFDNNPLTPPAASLLTLGNLGMSAPGAYALTVGGESGAIVRERLAALNVFTTNAAAPDLDAPANGASGQPLRPTFEWTAAAQAAAYEIEIADSLLFTNIVDSAVVTGTSYTPGADLPPGSQLFWRVRSGNACGEEVSTTRSFITEALAGQCAFGTAAVQHFADDIETGASGWTSGGTGNTWALSNLRANSGEFSYRGIDSPTVSDQRLDTPAIELPDTDADLFLEFWNYQHIESRTGGCWDGGMLEVSIDGGLNYAEVPNARMLTRPYDGPIGSGFSNPAVGRDAWCGDPRTWERMVVDLSPWAGETVHFRFRLATDSSVGREGWYIDDVVVRSCSLPEDIFADGFE